MALDTELSFVPGFPEELTTAEGLRSLALQRVQAALLIQGSDDPSVGVEQLLGDAETLLRGADQGVVLGEDDGDPVPLYVIERQVRVLRCAATAACRQGACETDARVLDELAYGIEQALGPWVRRDAEERDEHAGATLERLVRRSASAP